MRHALLMMVVVALTIGEVDPLARLLLEDAGGSNDDESAAFVVERPGGFELVPWPKARAFRSAKWLGPIPSGTVAVIHTHPPQLPRPSGQDQWEARRLRLPFYVASRTQLCVAEADGDVQCGNWLTR